MTWSFRPDRLLRRNDTKYIAFIICRNGLSFRVRDRNFGIFGIYRWIYCRIYCDPVVRYGTGCISALISIIRDVRILLWLPILRKKLGANWGVNGLADWRATRVACCVCCAFQGVVPIWDVASPLLSSSFSVLSASPESSSTSLFSSFSEFLEFWEFSEEFASATLSSSFSWARESSADLSSEFCKLFSTAAAWFSSSFASLFMLSELSESFEYTAESPCDCSFSAWFSSTTWSSATKSALW